MTKRNKVNDKTSAAKVVQEETDYFDGRTTVTEPQEEESLSQKETERDSPSFSLKIANEDTLMYREAKQDTSLESLPLDLKIGKVAKKGTLYSLKPKQPFDASRIQKHTSHIGHIGNIPKIVEGLLVPPPAHKHTVFVSHPEIFIDYKPVETVVPTKQEAFTAKPLVHPGLNHDMELAPLISNSHNYNDNVYNKNHLKQLQAKHNQQESLNKQLLQQPQNNRNGAVDFNIQNTFSSKCSNNSLSSSEIGNSLKMNSYSITITFKN